MNYIKKGFSDPEKITYLRFKASVFVFVVTNFLFFLCYFFAGANFYYDIMTFLLPFLYVLLILSYFILFIYIAKYKFQLKGLKANILFAFFFLFFILFLVLPIFGKNILKFF